MSAFTDRLYPRLYRLLMPRWRKQTRLDRWGIRQWTRLDAFLFKRFGWSAAARLMGVRVLLLRTTGRRTGRSREAMVAYLDDDDAIVIGGGNWGWDNDPAWFFNIQANPDVEVVRNRRTERRRATVLIGDALAAAEADARRAYPHSHAYVDRRTRRIPYVRLDPA
jgi:deazaflavin-dependent oxidoreductase (nitroreductase family)